ncbi:uridine diphosphate glucose pyrophosphatase NUDT22 isoform X2 [Notamacropus eugenii]|uniref:uridine diphosphate glucose pyrophosphatase NUDT22 isoform X2 n=1 Tax=Notamacropus eugenii TaxID=9315 RepID=UPI003B67A18B
MDPEVSLLVQCPPGGLAEEQDFLGTNWASSASRLRCQGKTDWGDAQAYLADPLGVGAMLGTSDGFLVFLRRSLRVAEAPGLIDVPGGHPEPQALFPGEMPRHEDLPEDLLVPELFSSILQEIRDEVNVPLSTLSHPLLLGIARNETSAGRASAEFYVSCSLTSEQVKTLYMTGGPEAHESTGIIFMETQRVGRLQEESEAWGELCPSAKGAILLYNLVQARLA